MEVTVQFKSDAYFKVFENVEVGVQLEMGTYFHYMDVAVLFQANIDMHIAEVSIRLKVDVDIYLMHVGVQFRSDRGTSKTEFWRTRCALFWASGGHMGREFSIEMRLSGIYLACHASPWVGKAAHFSGRCESFGNRMQKMMLEAWRRWIS